MERSSIRATVQCARDVQKGRESVCRAMHAWLGVVVILWVLITVTLARWVAG